MKISFNIKKLGEARHISPLVLENRRFISDLERVLYHNTINSPALVQPLVTPPLNEEIDFGEGFERAGPRKGLFFQPSQARLGIVTCGGLCPGINNVVRAITYHALKRYGVNKVYGFKHGFLGLTKKYRNSFVELDASSVNNIHTMGGSILSSSRGPQDPEEMVETLEKLGITVLFTIGGDGTLKGAHALAAEIEKKGLPIGIIGIPKTIDNDIAFITKSFGFATAVEQACKAIGSAHAEAKGTINGIGIVKLMGRNAGFIAAQAALAAGDCNLCLIPEEQWDLQQLFEKIKQRLLYKDHLLIVVAEGCGIHLEKDLGSSERDASGNRKIPDVGVFLRNQITEFLKAEEILGSVKYIDPSYLIRSVPANTEDAAFALQLGNHAVHAALAGKTDMLIGHWHEYFTHVPITLATSRSKRVDLDSHLWQAVKTITI